MINHLYSIILGETFVLIILLMHCMCDAKNKKLAQTEFATERKWWSDFKDKLIAEKEALTNEKDGFQARILEIEDLAKNKLAWERDAMPHVPVLQPRYDNLKAEVKRLESELTKLKDDKWRTEQYLGQKPNEFQDMKSRLSLMQKALEPLSGTREFIEQYLDAICEGARKALSSVAVEPKCGHDKGESWNDVVLESMYPAFNYEKKPKDKFPICPFCKPEGAVEQKECPVIGCKVSGNHELKEHISGSVDKVE